MTLLKRKLCVVTGSRADYGLLKHFIKAISLSASFQYQLVVTGSHLSKNFGYTSAEIEADGFYIDKKIDIEIQGDSPSDISASTAIALKGFSAAYLELRPDLVIILGDRYELLGAAIAAMYHGLPIGHFHGGESTVGAMDEGIRHALTKFSHIHFVATEEYRNRVLRLGENPAHVFNVGGLGADAITRLSLLSKEVLEHELGIKFQDKNLLITFHPVTLEQKSSTDQMQQLLSALDEQNDKQLIFTMPNADTESLSIFKLIEEFVSSHVNAHVFTSLGQLRYYSCINQVDAVIGNSSSGLLEVPTFKKPTINIGDRQKGRLRASSVIDCDPIKSEIIEAIERVYQDEFIHQISNTKNPYGEGGSIEKIINALDSMSFPELLKKEFYDFPD